MQQTVDYYSLTQRKSTAIRDTTTHSRQITSPTSFNTVPSRDTWRQRHFILYFIDFISL